MKYGLPIFVTAFALAMAFYPASSQEANKVQCPQGVPSCKVVLMSPDEIRSLTQPGGIFDQALWANRSGMEGLILAWRQKLAGSPDGVVAQSVTIPAPVPSATPEPKKNDSSPPKEDRETGGNWLFPKK